MNILDRVRNEPVLVTGLLTAVLALLAAFGLSLSDEQVGAILAVTASVLAFVVRSKVTPVRKHRRRL